MNIIGIIAPNEQRIKRKNLIKRNKPDFIYIEKHLARIVVAYDNSNYNKIFRKQNVKVAVVADNARIKKSPKCKVCDGQDFFNKNLMYFVTKAFKINGLNSETSSIAVITDEFTEYVVKLIHQASKIFRYLIIVSENISKAQEIIKLMFEEYGVYIELKNPNEPISCELSVELSKNIINYKNNTIILNIDSNISVPMEYYLSLPHKIPFKANNMALSEALGIIKKSI